MYRNVASSNRLDRESSRELSGTEGEGSRSTSGVGTGSRKKHGERVERRIRDRRSHIPSVADIHRQPVIRPDRERRNTACKPSSTLRYRHVDGHGIRAIDVNCRPSSGRYQGSQSFQIKMEKASKVADVVSSPATYSFSVFTVIAGLTINEWVAIGGLTLGLLTFAVNLYYKHKHYELAKGKKDE